MSIPSVTSKKIGHDLIISCALAAEARVLIDKLRLTRVSATSMGQLYCSTNNRIALLITGVGLVNCLISTSWLVGERDCSGALWLNTGIAGHRTFSLGTLCWASSVCISLAELENEQNTGLSLTQLTKKYYPYLVPGLEKLVDECVALATHLYPCARYDFLDSLVDMEGWALCSVALRLTSLENIHFIKLVSDNGEHHFKSINKQQVINLYWNNIDRIMAIVDLLLAWQASNQSKINTRCNVVYEQVMANLRATVSQQHLIFSLLNKALALSIPEKEIASIFSSEITCQAGINILSQVIDNKLRR